MKKNLKSCVEQPYYGEPECLLDMNNYEMITASGLTPDLKHMKHAHMCARWNFSETTCARFELDNRALSAYRYLTFSVFAIAGQGGSFSIRFESDTTQDGESGYVCTLPVSRNGWNDYRLELPFLRARKNVAGWDRIRAIVLDCAEGGQANSTDTSLCFDNFYVWDVLAPQIYVRMPELKGAAMFSKGAAYAVVDRKRLPVSPEMDSEARPFEQNGVLWLPMAPVAAVIAHKAVVDTKAYTLSFTYRRGRYVFYGNSDRYLFNGAEQSLPFRPLVRAGTLFFPATYLRDFFHWRQMFTDPNGLILLSNRKNAFENGRDDNILWQLNAELTFVQPTGEEILNDLHRKIPNPDKGRLLLLPEEWMTLRRAVKTDAELKNLLGTLKNSYGHTSDAYKSAPVFADGLPEETSLREGIAQAADRILHFAALYRLTGEKRYAERTAAEAESLAALSDWDAAHSMLNASAVGFAMAIGYDWCHSVWSEGKKALMERAMLRYAMRPGVEAYLGKGYMWRQGGADSAQINCGMIAMALALADIYPETALKILRYAPGNLLACFAAYAPDGGYAESLSAWQASTRSLVLAIAMLQSACGKDYGFACAPGFASTAFFPVHTETANGAWNYHDCAAGQVDTSLAGWFSLQYGDPVPAWLRRQELLSGKKQPGLFDLIFRVPADDGLSPELPLDAVYRKAGLAILRSGWGREDAFFGLHGGSNHEWNGELDAGSFLLEMGGVRFFAETGGCEELPMLLRRRAEGQNTVVVDPADALLPDQNPDAVVGLTEARSVAGHAYAVMDMTSISDTVLKAKRGILLTDDRKTAVVQDEMMLTGAAEIVWSAYTQATAIYIGARTLVLEQNGKKLLCKLCGAGNARFEVQAVEGSNFNRIIVRAQSGERFRMAVAFRLMTDEMSRSETIYQWKPMSTWML